MTTYISVADTAKLVRKALKENFAGIKFSVRSSSYAGGASIRVEWLDGPCMKDVDKTVKQFEGATFDSSIDLKSYVHHEIDGEEVHFGADYVMTQRHLSRNFVETIVRQFCDRFGISMLEVIGDKRSAHVNAYAIGYSMEHWLQELLRGTDAKDMQRAYAAQEERVEREREEWASGAAERERKEREQEAKEEAERKAQQARKAEHERLRREEQERQQRAEQERARQQALAYLKLPSSADRYAIIKAFRNRVKASADGHGGYKEDMDLLVKAKEKALQ